MEKLSNDKDKGEDNKSPVKVKPAVQSGFYKAFKELNNSDTVKVEANSTEIETYQNKTPEKKGNSEFEQKIDSVDNDDGMLSTVEQARLLIAASKTPSKTLNRTPVKQKHTGGKRSIESSPVIPGKQRRVELITLSSPKAKRLIQG